MLLSGELCGENLIENTLKMCFKSSFSWKSTGPLVEEIIKIIKRKKRITITCTFSIMFKIELKHVKPHLLILCSILDN